MKNRLFFALFSLFLTVTASLPALAGDLVVTRYFSGLWEQPQHESQGLVLQIIDQEDAEGDPKAVAYWFTYGEDQQSAWFIAIGEVEGDQVVMDLYATSGVDFLQPASAEFDPVERIGMLTLTFMNCNKGTATYALDADEGSEETFEIRRLAALYNSRCSGGISDNTPADAKPLMLEVGLLPVEDGADGQGKAKFWERSDRSDFHVAVEDLPDELYSVMYCDVFYEDVLDVFEGEGAVQFRSPEAPGKLLLIEDPRDCTIDVLQGDVVFLTSAENVLGEKVPGGSEDGDDADLKVTVDLENPGIIPDASGSVQFKVEDDETLFSVRTRDLPKGDYIVWVDDADWGVLSVANENATSVLNLPGVEAPWNAMIQIVDSEGEVVLWAGFPEA
ncbi:MAG: hypothetical protein P8Y52_09890 [Xanthomonadales bacterium]